MMDIYMNEIRSLYQRLTKQSAADSLQSPPIQPPSPPITLPTIEHPLCDVNTPLSEIYKIFQKRNEEQSAIPHPLCGVDTTLSTLYEFLQSEDDASEFFQKNNISNSDPKISPEGMGPVSLDKKGSHANCRKRPCVDVAGRQGEVDEKRARTGETSYSSCLGNKDGVSDSGEDSGEDVIYFGGLA